MTGPLYRTAGPFDTALLAELHRQCFTHGWDQPWSEKSFGDVLAMPGAACLISVAAEAPIAFGLTLQAADEVELLLLGTLPAARGQGAGRALLDRLRAAGLVDQRLGHAEGIVHVGEGPLSLALEERRADPLISAAEELARYFLICLTFLAASHVTATGGQIRMEEVQAMIPSSPRWILQLVMSQ